MVPIDHTVFCVLQEKEREEQRLRELEEKNREEEERRRREESEKYKDAEKILEVRFDKLTHLEINQLLLLYTGRKIQKMLRKYFR